MGLPQPQDRLSQSEFTEIHDALDITGSVALNVRQPVGAQTAPRAASAAASGSADAGHTAQPDVLKTTGEQNPSTCADANTEEEPKPTGEVGPETQETKGQPTERKEADKEGGTQPSTLAATAAPCVAAVPAPGAEVATLQQILRTKDCNLALVSDVDEQLLLNISFKQPIRLASFSILATTPPQGFPTEADAEDSVSAPMVVKVYCNKSTLNFCGVVDEVCAFSVSLKPEDVLTGRRIALPGSKFHMCSSAQFFIQENQAGASYTFLNRLVFYGVAHKRYS
ncbi:hypothetical protein, conserved [Eimeria praecox]|uniref:PITH domain-containing protein n=1 Tax=Eimeria praecox TaxID=51316 RepID=U6G972_9EIME|nr:hypothetical protein, conserved [Eimeria praecox]